MGKTPGIMQNIKVKSAKINRMNKKVTVEIHSDKYIYLDEEKELSRHFKKHFDTENLGIVCSMENVELGKKEIDDIIGRLVDHCPTLMPYKERISIENTGDSIILTFPDICKSLMNATGSIRHISGFISGSLKIDAELKCKSIEVGNGKSEYLQIKQDLMNKTIEENKKIANEYKKPVVKSENYNSYHNKNSYESIQLSELNNEFDRVSFKCEVIDFESNVTKRGKTLLRFDATDYTSSITCKIFTDDSDGRKLKGILQPGMSVSVEGRYGYDSYDSQNIVMARNITECEPLRSQRTDNSEQKRVELHLHTKMSSKDGFIEPGRLFRTLAEWGHKSVAITDHGVVQAFPEAAENAEKYGIKPIYGVEGYLVDDSRAFMYNPDDKPIEDKITLAYRTGDEIRLFAHSIEKNSDEKSFSARDISELAESMTEGMLVYFSEAENDTVAAEMGTRGIKVLSIVQTLQKFTDCKWLSKTSGKGTADNPADKVIELWEKIKNGIVKNEIKTSNELCVMAAKASVKKNMRQYHVIILAKNKKGLKSLYELISYSHGFADFRSFGQFVQAVRK